MTPKPTLQYGSANSTVVELQHRLNACRAATDAALATDGIFGNLTLAAVKKFQTKAKLVVDGIVGPLTWGALMVATINDTTAVAAQILNSAQSVPMPLSFLIRGVINSVKRS
jgi:peptidoglycan hydrolase-like protein with peptidoglycan-binding domain